MDPPRPTAREVVSDAGVDLTGKVALVTGASSGIGVETVRELARAVRDPAAATVQDVLRDLAASLGADLRTRLDTLPLDLGDLASVRRCANLFLARRLPLHLLINNAGIMACPQSKSADGYELQFATNHLGHFVLTNMLVPALRAGAPARIVNVSSRAHLMAPMDFDDVHFERRRYGRWQAYGQSKTANILFTVELQRRLGLLGISAFSLHPGVIMTNLLRHVNAANGGSPSSSRPSKPKDEANKQSGTPPRRTAPAEALKTVEEGAATTLYAALHPSLADRGGVYLEDCR